MTRRAFLHTGAAGLAAPGALGAEPPARRPNILFILTDDQGFGDIRSHGNDKLDTPTLDKLAADGARFDRFFVSPLCAPTRASLLTGRYFLRTGTSWVAQGKETMRLEEVTIAQVLKAAGYATGIFGKWHNGEVYPHHPLGKGFDEFFGFCGGGISNYFDVLLEHNGQPVQTKGFITDVLTGEALRFIEANRGRPFLCYVPYNAPHSPFQVPDKYFDKYAARGFDPRTASIYGMVENVDDNVARLLAKLDELALSSNTIVVFITDNGPNGPRFNAGMKGAKGSADEGGVRVPCFIRWPARIKAGTVVHPIAAHIDILPTLAELCGVEALKTPPLDGVSLVPLLEGAKKGTFSFSAKQPSAPQGGEKVNVPFSAHDRTLFEVGAARTPRWRFRTQGKKAELFDMLADPGQKTNVAADHPDVVKQLAAAYAAWEKDVRRGQEGMPPPLPVGHDQARAVLLRTHLASVENVERQTPWTNGYMKAWPNTHGRVTWELDVVKGGRYDAELVYVCAPADVGARVRLEAGDSHAEAVVDRPADTASVATNDRVPRGEADVKKWATCPISPIELKPGPAKLIFRVTELPGKQAFVMQGVRLMRQ
ncbi:MAG: arylsulfatase [Planctomycetes bacterium]|nr:arylsulfatase [Planctomycetota bacterium]